MKLPDWMKDTPKNREYFERVREMSDSDIVQDVDGFYYYDVSLFNGVLSSNDLKCIAWILEQMNEPWNEHINKHLQ